MTDADVDGSHIGRCCSPSSSVRCRNWCAGKIYIAQPPLYQACGKKSQFVLNDENMNNVLVDLALRRHLVVRDDDGKLSAGSRTCCGACDPACGASRN